DCRVQLLNKIGTKHRFAWVLIDVMAGALASQALPPFFIVPALCFLCLPVWRVIHANSRVEAAGIFGAAGFGWFLASIFWVSHALIVSAPALWFLTPFMALALALILSIFWAVAAAASWIPHASARVRVLCFLGTFGLIEWTRSFVASGFPFSLMGSVFAVHLGSLQMASVMGIYGLTVLTFGCVIAPVLWLLSARRLALFLLVLPALGTGWGIARLDRQPAEPPATAPIARLVQPAVPQQDKWNRQKRPAHLADLINLSQAGANKPDIVIWPETAFAGLPGQNRLLLADTVQAAMYPGGFLLTGIPRLGGDNRPLNSAFLFDHQAGLRGVYDKRHLVPFGEYVPFRSWMPFLDIIAGPADFVAGKQNHLIAVPGIGQVQTLICYEVIFAGHVVAPQLRPDLMVNVTNDA
ncbi:MAG: apolipoprotein N-acyltransferase, partial [Pseudomonadota bacterium]|nr:apolipoprotein N-acyltransferase [Pseudomonadota bacterium]